jgi:two-component system cell cycle sensor histidine kinase/response regulator CckA
MGGPELVNAFDDAFRQAFFQALVSNVDGYVSCIDRERHILFLNRTLTREMSDILGKRIDDFILSPHREAVIERIEHAFQSGEAQHVEFAAELPNGDRRHLRTRIVAFKSPRGEDVALQLTTDVTESRRLAEKLEQSIELRRQVVENVPDYIALMNRERRFVWVNRVAAGLNHSDVVGHPLDSFVPPEALALAERAIDTAFESATIEHYEAEGTGDGGAAAWYAVRVVPVMSEGQVKKVLLIAADVTERKRSERILREKDEQLHRAQRLESVGQLAGGIAHDFNNLLQVIEGNLCFVKEALQAGQNPLHDLEQALRATERAGELTAHLLAIGRQSRVATQRVALGTLVEEGARILRRAIPENVALHFEPPRQTFLVDLDPPQFEQVLINLCVNARDAMPDGGTISIQLQPEGERHVLMTVSDTGTGVSPENLGRIFDPFFSTKGTGSGLGLAVAAGIVEAHGGELTAESDGHSGTRMKVRLPRVTAAPEPPLVASRGFLRGSGVILVAEDEALVRAQVDRLLRRAGYTVLQAENGARAVELFRQNQGSVALVLMDVVMPELDGWKAYLQMEALDPNVKVLFTTGYAANVLPPDYGARGARLVAKPYRPQQLLGLIGELLAEP